MSEPKTNWREYYEKNKVMILVCAAIGVAITLAGGEGNESPVVVYGGDVPAGDTGGDTGGDTAGGPMTIEEWNKDQDRKEKNHEVFVESVIREEQTCSNGKVISIHDTCPDE